MSLPVIDVQGLMGPPAAAQRTAAEIAEACRQWGFFYAVNHSVDTRLIHDLEQASREFFAQDLDRKLEIRMSRGGRAWRGYFAAGDELTSGYPDLKEGIYFGSELSSDHPLVRNATPLHGQNLFPADTPRLRPLVLAYLQALTQLGHQLMRGLSLSLGLEESYFHDYYTADPLILFRIFNYPPASRSELGVGEHTDYGFLTMLWQDEAGGLQLKRGSDWVDVAPLRGSFVCNIGDMLDRLTGGLYRSAPHRVQNPAKRDRLSFAFFFDPNFNAEVKAIRAPKTLASAIDRWDQANIHEFRGTYGEYLMLKVAKVFPELGKLSLH